jgi:hypothetical protein
MESGVNNSSENISADMRKAQSIQYARSIEQYSLLSTERLLNSASWQDGTFANVNATGIIDEANFGNLVGAASGFSHSGFCVHDDEGALKAKIVTWFESSSDEAFILKGVGENAEGAILSELSKRIPEGTYGTYLGQGEIDVSGRNIDSLPAGCSNFDIPEGSPVIFTTADVPAMPDDAVTRTEFTTTSCENNQVGHILLSLDVVTYIDGRRKVAGTNIDVSNALPTPQAGPNQQIWEVVENLCQTPKVLATMETNIVNVSGLNLSMAAGNRIGNNINNNLSSIRCREAAAEIQEAVFNSDETGQNYNDVNYSYNDYGYNSNDDGSYGYVNYGSSSGSGWSGGSGRGSGSGNSGGSGRGNDTHNNGRGNDDNIHGNNNRDDDGTTNPGSSPDRDTETAVIDDYTTCGLEVDVADIDGAGEVRVVLDRIERETTPCGGASGNFTDSVSGYTGTVSHPAWSGNASYYREVYMHEAQNIINASVDREMRERWYGDDMNCSRQEDLQVTCNSAYTGRSADTLLDNRGFNYRRTNRINGWADPANLTPNDPSNPNWNYRAGASGCQWRQDETWGCNVGTLGQTQQGRRNRTHTVATLGASLNTSSWNVIQPALCGDRRTTSGTCPAGQTGTVTITEGRTYTSNSPGNGGWSAWSEVSRTSNCQASASSNSSASNDIDVDGDGVGDYSNSADARADGWSVSDRSDVNNCGNCGSGVSGGDSGDTSDDGSVLCTYYNVEKGWLKTRIYRGSCVYGAKNLSRESLNGYHYWGVPLVRFLRKHQGSFIEKAVFKVLVEGWTTEMAYRTGYYHKGSLRGKVILATIKPLCTLIGHFVEKSDYKKLWHGFRTPSSKS